MEKIVLLDFDGVLNCFEGGTCVANPDNTVARVFVPGPDVRPIIEAVLAARLERILQATGAKIVISSSWRSALSLETTQSWLRERGVRSARVVGRTAIKNENKVDRIGFKRSDYVDEFVRNNPQMRCVALDDDTSITMLSYGVYVDPDYGLADIDVEHAIDILNGG